MVMELYYISFIEFKDIYVSTSSSSIKYKMNLFCLKVGRSI